MNVILSHEQVAAFVHRLNYDSRMIAHLEAILGHDQVPTGDDASLILSVDDAPYFIEDKVIALAEYLEAIAHALLKRGEGGE